MSKTKLKLSGRVVDIEDISVAIKDGCVSICGTTESLQVLSERIQETISNCTYGCGSMLTITDPKNEDMLTMLIRLEDKGGIESTPHLFVS